MGKEIGGLGGSLLDDGVDAIMGKIIGSGDYKIKSNSFCSAYERGNYQFGASSKPVRIRHREMFRNVISSNTAGGFTNKSFAINPANSALFPWLAHSASSFQQWELKGMLVYYRSTSGTAVGSTNSSMGKVMIATNYDPVQPAYTSSVEMEASEYCTVTIPSCNATHATECARGTDIMDKLLVGSPHDPADDLRFHDMGTIQIASEGVQGTAVTLGEVWVVYDIELSKPVINTTTLGGFIRTRADCTPVSAGAFLMQVVPVHRNNLVEYTDTGTVRIHKSGRYFILTTSNWNTSITSVFYPTAVVNCTTHKGIAGGENYQCDGFDGQHSATIMVFDIDADTHEGYGEFDGGSVTCPGTLDGASIHIFEVPAMWSMEDRQTHSMLWQVAAKLGIVVHDKPYVECIDGPPPQGFIDESKSGEQYYNTDSTVPVDPKSPTRVTEDGVVVLNDPTDGISSCYRPQRRLK